LHGVESLGVDEHIWRPGRFGAGREVTCMVGACQIFCVRA
jgi:hypothetical protein